MKLKSFTLLALVAVLALGCAEDERSPQSANPIAGIDSNSEAVDFQRLTAEDEALWSSTSAVVDPEAADFLAKRSDDDHDDVDDHHGVPRSARSYEVTVENLTVATGPGASQPLSPPVFASHNRSMRMFHVGRAASEELAAIAQDADGSGMLDLLGSSDAVHDFGQGGGVILPGSSDSFEVETLAGARRLSVAFMLVNTNDGFSGLDSIRLPRHGSAVVDVYAYDAGSEVNSELAADIPGPCCGSPGMGTPSHERIHLHEGIRGDADLDAATYGWNGPVARITIRRLEPAYSVRLENLTPATGAGSSQVFSPPVIATHARGMHMFRVGHKASMGMTKIAEDAINGPMVARFSSSPRVLDVQEGGGVIVPGAYDEYVVETAPGFRRLSMGFMLVNTNDGFSGVDSFFLPRGGRRSHTFRAYDAGSEKNTELATDIPGPCCGSPEMGTPTEERIRRHRGILGVGDLDPDVYGWDGAVMKLTITRIR